MTDEHRRPNFLFIITDQQRHDHLSCAGNELLRTPNIDGLAAGGVRFENFYVASAVCMPNRASIMTGRMPSLHGVRFNGIPLSRNSVTFVDLLRSAGYRTALLGKSHLQNVTDVPSAYPHPDSSGSDLPNTLREARMSPIAGVDYEMERRPTVDRAGHHALKTPFYGFDHVELCTRHGDMGQGNYADWLEERHPGSDELRSRDNLIPEDRYTAPQAFRTRIPEPLYSTSYVAERTSAYIDDHVTNHPDQPFFVQCSFPDPHHPYTPPGRYWDMYDPADVALPVSFNQRNLPPTVADIHRQSQAPGFDRSARRPFAVSEREAREITALTYGMITNIDDAIGRIRRQLEVLGIADNTVVIFTSDHGDFMGERGIMLKGPLHYQGIAKVPFIWMDPGASESGDVQSALGSSLDISATVLGRAGLSAFNGMQGCDLQAVMRGHVSSLRGGLLIEQDTQAGNFGFEGPIRARTYVTERWRMSIYQGHDFAELYDLREDPYEMTNVWDSAPERGDLLRAMVDKMAALQDVSPAPTLFA
jgi:arylsulfatase A-like enzyme